ncbi:hypothetical protein JCM7686_pAMI8p059 (plasmid) [Paracoccus aminophilus JCM 7686]|uniref:Uncharacterized protein n=1 Tax=Paracoccus aminophilus JCM 7686 TaxID=1367847 RepID=S5Y7T9_PARAH|nr:hypothetical protein JCM7686_pAMI8p059 [Paracoccus aminophilus JCM 7686]
MIEQHPDEGRAIDAFMKLACTKQRRAYDDASDRR